MTPSTKPQKLSPAQVAHLERIAAGPGKSGMPAAGWFNTRPEQKLEGLGLVRHWTHEARLGGAGAMGGLTVGWYLAELTEAGKAWLAAHRGTGRRRLRQGGGR